MNFAENEHKILKFWKKGLDKGFYFGKLKVVNPTVLSALCRDGGFVFYG